MTANDLERLAFNEALSFYAGGRNAQGQGADPRVARQAFYRGYGLLPRPVAARRHTARIGVLPFDMQMHYLSLLKPTVVVGVPSFLLRLARELANSRSTPKAPPSRRSSASAKLSVARTWSSTRWARRSRSSTTQRCFPLTRRPSCRAPFANAPRSTAATRTRARVRRDH